MPVGGVGKADGQLLRILFRLGDALRQFLVPGLGFNDRELAVAIDKYIIGNQWLRTPSQALHATECDGIFTENAAPLDDAPTSRLESRVNVLGSGFRFVHVFFFLSFAVRGNF